MRRWIHTFSRFAFPKVTRRAHYYVMANSPLDLGDEARWLADIEQDYEESRILQPDSELLRVQHSVLLASDRYIRDLEQRRSLSRRHGRIAGMAPPPGWVPPPPFPLAFMPNDEPGSPPMLPPDFYPPPPPPIGAPSALIPIGQPRPLGRRLHVSEYSFVHPTPDRDAAQAIPEREGTRAQRKLMVFFWTLERAADTARRLLEQEREAKQSLCEGALRHALDFRDVRAICQFTREHVGLSAQYWPAVVEVLNQGTWRDASEPLRYIRVAARHVRTAIERKHKRQFFDAKREWSSGIVEVAHSRPRDLTWLYERLHDCHLTDDEQALFLAYMIAGLPRHKLAAELGADWDYKRVDRVRRSLTRKLHDFDPQLSSFALHNSHPENFDA
jgi:hypothetical protein